MNALDVTKRFEFVAQSKIPTENGPMFVRAYRNHDDNTEPVAMFFHPPQKGEVLSVRVHDACFTSEVLGSKKCDCKEQLEYALKYIAEHGGAVIYLQQEGRGIGLANKIAVYALQEQGLDTVEANRALHFPDDAREYDIVPFMLDDLEVKSIRLLTNNPRKVKKLSQLGIEIVKRINVHIPHNQDNIGYLHTKQQRMGHLLDIKKSEE